MRKRLEVLSARKIALIRYWEQELSVLFMRLKADKELMEKLRKIRDAVRDAIISKYIERCNLQYGILFMQWRLSSFEFDKETIE